MNVSVHFSSLSWPYAVPTAQILFSFSFYLFLAAFVLCCCRGLSLVAVSGGYTLAAVHGLLTAVASLVAEHRLQGVQASVVAAPGLSSCGAQA